MSMQKSRLDDTSGFKEFKGGSGAQNLKFEKSRAKDEALHHLEREYQELRNLHALAHDKPRVVAWGIVKAGKSSLLNMLADSVQEEVFRTGVTHTTTENLDMDAGSYILMDTPGLDVDPEAQQRSFRGMKQADIILFVHAPPGELDQDEMRFLSGMKDVLGEDASQRLVLVLTQLDKDQNGSAEAVQEKILSQVRDQLDLHPQCFQVSNSRYKKGCLENKSVLVEKSGILELRNHLKNLSLKLESEIKSFKSIKLNKMKIEIIERIIKEINEDRNIINNSMIIFHDKITHLSNIISEFESEYMKNNSDLMKKEFSVFM